MIRVGVVGLGKMGLSHLAILNMHPEVEVAAICDASGYVLGLLRKYTGVKTYSSFDRMLREVKLDAVVIATPSSTHAALGRTALERDLAVFCEKPLTLDAAQSEALAALARDRGLVTQVGYHHRFIGAFSEVKRLLDAGAIGRVTHALGEAYGPVVLRPRGTTWRSRRSEGGGSLYDYAAHPIDLVSWFLGAPLGVAGTVLSSVFSRDTEDEVFCTLHHPEGRSAQISVSWSDESQRKMSTEITIWGTAGRIYANRQECQVYLRDTAPVPDGYEPGWNVRYTTDLTSPVWFYLRGEEYSAQVDAFVQRVEERRTEGANSFASAAVTDRVIAMMLADARAQTEVPGAGAEPVRQRRRRFRRAPASGMPVQVGSRGGAA
jgi:predicted dehydrogenase